jgi:hypothetical protein
MKHGDAGEFSLGVWMEPNTRRGKLPSRQIGVTGFEPATSRPPVYDMYIVTTALTAI